MVIIAFATVYIVWGSTYFFIQKAVQHIPPLTVGVIRFMTAGLLMLGWCIIKGEKVWDWRAIKHASVSGLLMLLVGNGGVIWAEKTIPSSLAAVLVSAAPLWFVLLDKPKWKQNLTHRETVVGLIIGFAGVVLLFSEQAAKALGAAHNMALLSGLIILVVGSICWAAGSLYSKYRSSGSATVNTTWQMLAAGIAFIPLSVASHEWSDFHWADVTPEAGFAVIYLITMGSLAAYSAYVWLLQVRSATQVSTYAYVNPVVAVLLGVFFAGEKMSWMQVTGLTVILASVLLINLAKYRKAKAAEQPEKSKLRQEKMLA